MNKLQSETVLKIAAAGGGGGLPRAVKGLSMALPSAEISAIVTTGDGGSESGNNGSATGDARRAYGTVAMGDLWKTVRAVSGNGLGNILKRRFGPEDTLADLQSQNDKLYSIVEQVKGVKPAEAAAALDEIVNRVKALPDGKLDGHAYGNLVLTGLALDNGNDASKGVRELSKWAEVPKRIRVIPVTNQVHDVVMLDGEEFVYGEGDVDVHTVSDPKNARVWLQRNRDDDSAPAITPAAFRAVAESDVMLVGPGSIFTSLVPAIAVDGMAGALRRQSEHDGKLVVVGNLVQERKSTTGMALSDYVAKLQGPTGPNNDRPITGRPFDYVVYNNETASLPEGKVPINCDAERISALGAQALAGNLVEIVHAKPDYNDPIWHLRSEVDGVGHNMWGVVDVLTKEDVIPAFAA